MNKDLTVGRPERVLWMFCLPLFGSIIFQQLYNIADSLVAGFHMGVAGVAWATFTVLLLRVALAIVLSHVFGVTGIWCAWPVGWSIATSLSVLFYRRGSWEKK